MEAFRQILMTVSVVSLVAIVAGFGLCLVVRELTPFLAWMRRTGLRGIWAALLVVGLIHYGATKGRVTFPYTDVETRYLTDAGSYVTNDAVHVAWTRSPVVPASADFCGAVRPCGNTNDEDWVIFFESDFAHVTSPTNIPYAGAQTNNFQFFTTWTPGPTVHTNGVAVITWQRGDEALTNRVVTYRTGIYENGRRLAPNPAITNGPSIVIQATLTSPQTGETDE